MDKASFMNEGTFSIKSDRKQQKTPYPSVIPVVRSSVDSMHRCSRCKSVQQRKIVRFGPMDISLCANTPYRSPRISDKGVWTWWVFAWLFAPPSPHDPNQWYEIHESGYCCLKNGCGQYEQKVYRRQFSRLRRFIFACSDLVHRFI